MPVLINQRFHTRFHNWMTGRKSSMKLIWISSLRVLTGSLFALALPACSWMGIGGDDGWLRDRQGEYLNAEVTPRMDIPSNLDSFTIDDLYRIPPASSGERELYVTPPAPKPIDT